VNAKSLLEDTLANLKSAGLDEEAAAEAVSSAVAGHEEDDDGAEFKVSMDDDAVTPSHQR